MPDTLMHQIKRQPKGTFNKERGVTYEEMFKKRRYGKVSAKMKASDIAYFMRDRANKDRVSNQRCKNPYFPSWHELQV